ncbi:cell division protein FtsQ/DivIB [Candidatus Leptofilum sp.]|uniref:cell division protein FtsQ/DivIB n=1 Tax=Candidatus Leptofilum sp. TaxID=3241576 RepID=UPI003B5CC9AD
MKRRQNQPRRLRKQPKMRRVDSAMPLPRLRVPKKARRRRRRNQVRSRMPLTTLRQILLSARWISLGLLALSIYALTLIGLDENFYLTSIPVEGVVSVPATEVVQASNLAGSHVFAANPGAAAQQIMDNVPGIISAEVTLNWPNQVHINVTEDSPIAIWVEGSNQFWVTRNGRLIPARTESLGLLMIQSEVEIPAAPTPVAGEDALVAGEETAVPETISANMRFVPQDVLAGALLLKELRPNIERLYYRPGSGLSYQDGRGWRVYFGSGTDMTQKLVVYETIVDELLAQGLTPQYVSVSNQEKPYFLAQ